MIPEKPNNFLPSPFAVNGDKTNIPFLKSVSGRASFEKGFDVENQKPLRNGGVAPNRNDFNGMFHILSYLLFWAQSGGQWSWNNKLNYSVPSVVYHKDKLWWCLKANGMDTTAGAKEPNSNNKEYWSILIEELLAQIGGSSSLLNPFPVGMVSMFHGTSDPDGWFIMNGRSFDAKKYPKLATICGGNILPNTMGSVPRGVDTGSGADPVKNRSPGSLQSDAGRNIKGQIGEMLHAQMINGAFFITGLTGGRNFLEGMFPAGFASFDASREWGAEHTANEFRMANFATNFIIRHD